MEEVLFSPFVKRPLWGKIYQVKDRWAKGPMRGPR